jgi:chromate transporter
VKIEETENNVSTLKPSFKEAFLFWLKLGFISFGGPAGQIAIMHEFLVDKKRWISDSKFLHALNYCMLLPGPEAQQLATYVGWLLHGTKGGLTAGILFVLPSVFILLGLSICYVVFGSFPIVYALLDGLKPAIVTIVLFALIKITKKSLHSYIHYAVAIISFIAIYFLSIPYPLIIIGSIVIGIVLTKIQPKQFEKNINKVNDDYSEENYYINNTSKKSHTGFNTISILKKIIVGISLWGFPFMIFYFLSNEFPFWQSLVLFFTEAALITFGGAYAVLPFVAQVSVEKFHWLSKYQMIDGLALGETTPGPLIMVLAFVGFMGGYNHFNTLTEGSLALLTTCYYTFLPSIVFIFIGAPIVESTQHNHKLKLILNFVTSAVVGVILNLLIYLSISVLFSDQISFRSFHIIHAVWISVSFFALYRFKINLIRWIFISGGYGIIKYLLFT